MAATQAVLARFRARRNYAKCVIGAFLRYVERGRIGVLAREQWLTSKTFRDSRPFPGARDREF